MASTERNFFLILLSAVLVVSAVRDLYDKPCRGTKRMSTWFMAVFYFVSAIYAATLLR